MKVEAIVLSAGLGTRFNSEIPKPLIPLNGKPLISYSLSCLQKSPVVDSMILVIHPQFKNEYEKIVKEHNLSKIKHLVTGGATRAESVRQGMSMLSADVDVVLVHDGARPFMTAEMIDGLVGLCKTSSAAIVATPVKPTIKRVNEKDMTVKETLNRDELWEIQTPQAFHKDVLVRAHNEVKNDNPTDDAYLVEQLGIKVKILPGDYSNIKITTEEDLLVAEVFLKRRDTSRRARK